MKIELFFAIPRESSIVVLWFQFCIQNVPVNDGWWNIQTMRTRRKTYKWFSWSTTLIFITFSIRFHTLIPLNSRILVFAYDRLTNVVVEVATNVSFSTEKCTFEFHFLHKLISNVMHTSLLRRKFFWLSPRILLCIIRCLFFSSSKRRRQTKTKLTIIRIHSTFFGSLATSNFPLRIRNAFSPFRIV